MKIKAPTRVWVNQPSTLQPHHDLHGKRGIAIPEGDNENFVRIYFCEGPIISQQIQSIALSEVVGE